MKTIKLQDALFTACATCTVLAVGGALAVLLYEVLTLSVSLVESTMVAGDVWLRAF